MGKNTIPGQADSHRVRSAAAKTARWLTGQLVHQDGGLLATARGLIAAGLLTVAARLAPRLPVPKDVWPLAAGLLTLLSAALVLIAAGRRRTARVGPRPKPTTGQNPLPARPVPAPRETRPPDSRTVLDLHLRISVGRSGDPGPRPPENPEQG